MDIGPRPRQEPPRRPPPPHARAPSSLFEARNIKTMELVVMETLNWRLHICNFLDKFSEWSSGKDGSRLSACRSRPSAAYIVSLQIWRWNTCCCKKTQPGEFAWAPRVADADADDDD